MLLIVQWFCQKVLREHARALEQLDETIFSHSFYLNTHAHLLASLQMAMESVLEVLERHPSQIQDSTPRWAHLGSRVLDLIVYHVASCLFRLIGFLKCQQVSI